MPRVRESTDTFATKPTIVTDVVLEAIRGLERQVVFLSSEIAILKELLDGKSSVKDWYSTAEVAELMNISQYTVQQRWCNAGRITCEKDAESGKWRIPGEEFERLRRGGKPGRARRR